MLATESVAVTPQLVAPGEDFDLVVRFRAADPAAAQSLAGSMAGAAALFLLVPGSGAGVDAAALLETAAREAQVSRDAEKVLGHPGRSFAGWAQRNAAAFR